MFRKMWNIIFGPFPSQRRPSTQPVVYKSTKQVSQADRLGRIGASGLYPPGYQGARTAPVGSLATDPLVDRLNHNLNRPAFLLIHPNPADDAESKNQAGFYSAKEQLRRGLKTIDFPSSGKSPEWERAEYAFIEILPPTNQISALWPSATAIVTAVLGNERAVAVYNPDRGVVYAQ